MAHPTSSCAVRRRVENAPLSPALQTWSCFSMAECSGDACLMLVAVEGSWFVGLVLFLSCLVLFLSCLVLVRTRGECVDASSTRAPLQGPAQGFKLRVSRSASAARA
eukprot:CAMPEP_0173061400 /NCGR_PEP_ID=MMETSP1102-20130122/3194_1 /TAXON_ID=49646 /ORGANISM="Geminigera sp., Strain Caron Lab Isolate" /LENGTH=106 /DNA_ID=CAMNT_0013927861 /DNA_START=60 /DNA_END=380 /DNA_ORIENTATION=-